MTAQAKGTSLGPLLDPWIGPHGGIPRFDQVKTSAFKPALLKGMDLARVEIESIAKQKAAPNFENTILAFEDSSRPLGRAGNFYGVQIL